MAKLLPAAVDAHMIRTTDDLLKFILRVLPDATVEEDNEGQLIIYTGKREEKGVLVDIEEN